LLKAHYFHRSNSRNGTISYSKDASVTYGYQDGLWQTVTIGQSYQSRLPIRLSTRSRLLISGLLLAHVLLGIVAAWLGTLGQWTGFYVGFADMHFRPVQRG